MTQHQRQTPNSRAQQDDAEGGSGSQADLAQAYRDLARGEQAATALEANLSKIESKLDALLARLDSTEQAKEAKEEGKGQAKVEDERKKLPSVDEQKPAKGTEGSSTF